MSVSCCLVRGLGFVECRVLEGVGGRQRQIRTPPWWGGGGGLFSSFSTLTVTWACVFEVKETHI